MPQTKKQQIGRYEILQEIGRGAMGVVFKGRDPLIGRAVAVKTITSGVAESADLLERLYREARAAGGLQHPNIVTIYEMAESGGAPFIAMEYLEGESLEKLIARKPALSLGTKVGYVVQTCRALEYAHRRGVIHRDVKPANIVVTRDGIVKVVDFGIARIADTSKTQTGALLGTKGDATALEGLQALRPQFKALADAGGPLGMDARDYLNSVIPKAQKQIEDNLAAASESSANAAYEGAVKEYDRAVATQNMGMLRGRVLAAFQQIAQSGGIRAKEAARYVHALIPAALKKSGP